MPQPAPAPPRLPPTRVFLAFLALGLTSFGGPVAHIGYFREAFVVRRGWLDERGYAELVALCQMLPGPTSSQVGIGIGLTRAGLAGGLAAWLGFTAPSAVLMVGFGYGVVAFGDAIDRWGRCRNRARRLRIASGRLRRSAKGLYRYSSNTCNVGAMESVMRIVKHNIS